MVEQRVSDELLSVCGVVEGEADPEVVRAGAGFFDCAEEFEDEGRGVGRDGFEIRRFCVEVEEGDEARHCVFFAKVKG